ncbi:MAG: Transcriptional regulator, LysR family [uncultured Acetobacteraceae bacterium]|uniref:Transcriptional regulator, LysR family n=1 Tax=uncultured Acetobacteraceae bacterium TaxID=169975 RepID=A0A6J4HKC6_9PROT|nr:MAG: Transcriptional regulator, LysR family [uncultured Acetobacteraceae bacterium]
MSRPDEMAAFVRILDKGGFAPAARDLGLTPSALSKLVGRMEARLGVRLLARTTRRLSPTPEGEAYGARARDILALIEAAEVDAAAGRARPRGHLRVNTGTAFAKHRLVPALPDFFARFPEITLDLCVTDRRVDLVAEQADVLLRVGPLDDSSLVARKVEEGRRVICAAPAYLARRGAPRRPEDLLDHDCLVLHGLARFTAWPFRAGAAGIRTLAVRGRATTDSAEALRDMALAGLGVVRVTEFLVAGDLAAGRLVPLLGAEHVSEEVPVWAVMAPGRQRMPRVQAFVDFVAERAGAG